MDLERITHPLRSAKGSHQPGSGKGCAMNVISYINGDTHITDFPTARLAHWPPSFSYATICWQDPTTTCHRKQPPSARTRLADRRDARPVDLRPRSPDRLAATRTTHVIFG